MKMKKIAVTSGDPAGIGPEIISKALRFYHLKKDVIYIVYGKLYPFDDGNEIMKIDDIDKAESTGQIYWIEIDQPNVETGKPSKISGEIAYSILERCAQDLNAGKLEAVVTCPISKEAIQKTHPDFIGHTEFFAEKSNTEDVIMSFWGPHFNLALLTTHHALKNISNQLTEEFLFSKLNLIHKEVSKLIEKPKMAMLGLNPHAGEAGAFGKEDILIQSVLKRLISQNIKIDGPFPADTFFALKAANYDLIISAYHDQGLIPFKMISAEEGVNVTLGLPFVRTSVEHGTAYDIAGKNKASEKSLEKAIHFAEKMILPKLKEDTTTYSVFAKYYDNFMDHVNYDKWVKFVLNQYHKKFKKSPQSILELGCGTGNISTRLVKKGLNVDASDVSSEMLKIASQKPFKPKLFRTDMLSPIKKKYDFILLLFDSMNYLLKDEEISQLLENVQQSLNDDGMFIFDISTKKNCEKNFDGFIDIKDSENEYIVHQSDLDYSSNIQTTKLTFFLKKGYLFERKDEIHKQKIYKVKEIISLISESNLKLIGIYCIEKEENLLRKDSETLDNLFTRLFFVLEKK
ncbi:MAG: 4-hydroxythreonine-4-phosphate dehydrogenase PdxA [Armatimonadetes bacterium]|nr:4-hydroxythreonine-4-phosphate dehydrogenase PdxA [Armatimonadota bacterium]